jgi:SAM-dependent methyltransferase
MALQPPQAESPGGSPDDFQDLHAEVERHYSGTVARHGATALGVDWTCVPTQELRFVQLLKLCDFERPFSLNDIGCGYGALLGFLGRRHRGKRVDYLGVDLSAPMIGQARRLWARRRNAAFDIGARSPRTADYSVASGIFNIRFSVPQARWVELVRHSLDQIYATSAKGFAVNFLAALPAGTTGKQELYRTDVKTWAGFCRERYQAKVDVLDAYGMREFTLLVSY